MSDKTVNVEYVNTVSGAKISGTVYNQLKVSMKAKYTKVKQAAKKSVKKGVSTPVEAKK